MDARHAAPASHRVLLDNDRVRVLEVVIEPGAREPEHTHRAVSVMIVDEPARIRPRLRRGNPVRKVRKLPDRMWKLPRQEDDEAAEEGIGRILALSDGVFAIAITLLILEIAVPFPPLLSERTPGRPRRQLYMRPRCA